MYAMRNSFTSCYYLFLEAGVAERISATPAKAREAWDGSAGTHQSLLSLRRLIEPGRLVRPAAGRVGTGEGCMRNLERQRGSAARAHQTVMSFCGWPELVAAEPMWE